MPTLMVTSFHGDEICMAVVHVPTIAEPRGPAWHAMLVFCGIGAEERWQEALALKAAASCPQPVPPLQPEENPGDCSTS